MKKLIKSFFLILLTSIALTGCYAGNKHLNELGGLMLLDNTQLGRNKAFYSKHNRKAKKDVHNKFKKAARKNTRRTYRVYR